MRSCYFILLAILLSCGAKQYDYDQTGITVFPSSSTGNIITTAINTVSDGVLLSGRISSSTNLTNINGTDISLESNTNIFVSKFDSSLALMWIKVFDSSSLADVATDNSDENIVFVGSLSITCNYGGGDLTGEPNGDYLIVKLNSSGSHIWSKSFGTEIQEGFSVVSLDSTGNIFAGGVAFASIGDTDLGGGNLTTFGSKDWVIAKYNFDGNYLWSFLVGGSGDELLLGMAVSSGNQQLAICGYSRSQDLVIDGQVMTNQGDSDILLVVYSTNNGSLLWYRYLGSPSLEQGVDVAFDLLGNLYFVGTFGDWLDFGGGNYTFAIGGYNVFLAKYESNGTLLWQQGFGSTNNDNGHTIFVSDDNKPIITGSYRFAPALDDITLPYSSSYSSFMAKFNETGFGLWGCALTVTGVAMSKSHGAPYQTSGGYLTSSWSGSNITNVNGQPIDSQLSGNGYNSFITSIAQIVANPSPSCSSTPSSSPSSSVVPSASPEVDSQGSSLGTAVALIMMALVNVF